MTRIALGVQYVGTDWDGYQKQPSRNTVQDRLEIALEKFATVPLATTCAGRTGWTAARRGMRTARAR